VIASGIVPAALEMMDQSCIRAVEDSVYRGGIPRDAAAVPWSVDASAEAPSAKTPTASSSCSAPTGARRPLGRRPAGARAPVAGPQESVRRPGRLDAISWSGRRGAALPLPACSRRSSLRHASAGREQRFHAGDGNLIPTSHRRPGPGPARARPRRRAGRSWKPVSRPVHDHRDTGIGLDKLRYMPLVFDADSSRRWRALRRGVRTLRSGSTRGRWCRCTRAANGWGEPRVALRGRNPVSLLDRVRALLGSDALLESGGPDGVRASRPIPRTPWRCCSARAGGRVAVGVRGRRDLDALRRTLRPRAHTAASTASRQSSPRTCRPPPRLGSVSNCCATSSPTRASGSRSTPRGSADAAWFGRRDRDDGPPAQGFGPVRDHLLGVTFVTGDGRIVQSAGGSSRTSPVTT